MEQDKSLPPLSASEGPEAFAFSRDPARDGLAPLTATHFEFASKDARVNMRVPRDLLNAVKAAATRQGIPYQRFIRQALEQAVQQ